MNTCDKILDKADAEIMDFVYEIIKINFDADIIVDSTELREILNQTIYKVLMEVAGEKAKIYKSGDFLEHRNDFNYGINRQRQEIINFAKQFKK